MCRIWVIFVFVFTLPGFLCAEDLVVDGTFEANIDLPKVWFIIKRDPNGPALEVYDEWFDEYYFVPNYGYLDTGASGILLSLETAQALQINNDPCAVYIDVGVGGDEYFDVSEPLYLGVADYNMADPCDQSDYSLLEQWQFQVSQREADLLIGPIDLIGIPAMAGKVVVFDTGVTNSLMDLGDINDIWEINDISLGEFAANIIEPDNPNIPQVDFEIPLIFENFLSTDNPENIPPLPVGAYNPLIKNVTVEYNGVSVTGNWLLDTGAAASIMNSDTAYRFGLINDSGEPLITPDYTLLIGGVGGTAEIPGYILNKLSIPTMSGFNLVYASPRIAVHDIAVYDFKTEEWIVLDGIFGDNFLTLSTKIEDGWPGDL